MTSRIDGVGKKKENQSLCPATWQPSRDSDGGKVKLRSTGLDCSRRSEGQ